VGAAAWISEDASWFSSALKLDEQLKALEGSTAYHRLMVLPGVQMLRTMVLQMPAFRAFSEATQKNELLKKALAVCSDAASAKEVFISAGAPLADLLEALTRIYLRTSLAGLQRGIQGGDRETEAAAATAAAILDEEKSLRVPPVIVGFRLARPEAARDLIRAAVREHSALVPVPIETQEIDGAAFWHARFSLEKIAPDRVASLKGLFESEGVPEELASRLTRLVASLTLAASAGVRGEYLIISIAPDTTHLAKLGKGKSLASSDALRPVFRHWRPRICGLSYTSHRLTGGGKLDAAAALAAMDRWIAGIPTSTLPEELRPRLKKDAEELLQDVNRYQAEGTAEVTANYLEKGIESYTFSAREPLGPDPKSSLETVRLRGEAPLVLSAERLPVLREAYGVVARWVVRAWGYFDQNAARWMKKDDLRELDRLRRTFLPAIAELHSITSELLLPAIDNCEVSFVADRADIQFAGAPEPVALLRPALIFEVRDREKLVSAFARYRKAVNAFLKSAATEYRSESIEIPEPQTRSAGEGTVYAFPGAGALGPDFEPHTLLAGKHAVLGLWPGQSEALLKPKEPLDVARMELSAPAGRILRLELEALLGLLLDDAGITLRALRQSGSIPDGVAQLVGLHLVELRPILGTFKSYTSREYSEEGVWVRHSWLRVEDIAE